MACVLGKEHVCCTSITDLSVKIGNEYILKNVNLHLHCGELTAIIGRNGAGKTTFMKALLNVIPHTGKIIFESEKISGTAKKDPHHASFVQTAKNHGWTTTKPLFGYVPQSLTQDPSNPFSVEDFVLSCTSKYPVWFFRRKKDILKVQEILKTTNAQSLAKKRVGELSGGELQRVLLALAIHPLPDILLLDEPVSGVDHLGLKSFYELVSSLRRDYDITILLISHDLDLVAKHADRVVFINESKAVSGSVNEIFSSKDFIEVFGSSFIQKNDNGGVK